MLQGEILVFCFTFVLIRGHIFASIEKFGSHLWNIANELSVAYTDFTFLHELIRLLRWLDPVFLGGYHPTLKLSGIPTFTFIVSLTQRMDNI